MKNNHKSAKLDALLFKAVKIVFLDGSTEKGLLYDHDSAIKYTGRILCNTPYFLMLYDGTMLGFYKTHVKKIIYNGVKVINRGKCMLCGKELTEGIFFCKECEKKGETKC